MGKKLIIKGADFSANGFHYETVTRTITTLVNKSGATVSADIAQSDSVYYYQHTNGTLVTGQQAGCCSTSGSVAPVTFIDVQDYTKATVTTYVNLEGSGVVASVCVMFFLDASNNIIGGIGVGGTTQIENVGKAGSVRTFTRAIPANCKYVVCSVTSNRYADFSLVLEKQVISTE